MNTCHSKTPNPYTVKQAYEDVRSRNHAYALILGLEGEKADRYANYFAIQFAWIEYTLMSQINQKEIPWKN